MKNKRYRELAAILVMMTMTAGSITTVAAETEITAEEETTAETETDEPETETAEDAENADSEAAETADTQSQAAALEVTDRFAQQTAVDEALLQSIWNVPFKCSCRFFHRGSLRRNCYCEREISRERCDGNF